MHLYIPFEPLIYKTPFYIIITKQIGEYCVHKLVPNWNHYIPNWSWHWCTQESCIVPFSHLCLLKSQYLDWLIIAKCHFEMFKKASGLASFCFGVCKLPFVLFISINKHLFPRTHMLLAFNSENYGHRSWKTLNWIKND